MTGAGAVAAVRGGGRLRAGVRAGVQFFGKARNGRSVSMRPRCIQFSPGRRPTRIGGDGWPPSLLVPHRLLQPVVRVLRRHRVEFELTLRVSFELGRRQDPDGVFDRLVFPRNDADQIQALVDAVDWPDDARGSPT